ncbi:hypothetical protein HOG11_04055, partial [bacterium]|nr:hypothetical protein [bacterium]
IGGDDTLSTAAKLYHEEDIPVIGLPKTIDNDLPHTYFSPGFPSAAHYTAKLIDEVREDAAYAYGRVFIIEVMGAKSGWLTCSSAVGGADIIIPPEWQFDLKKLLNLIKKKYKKNGYCVIAMSKEANIKGLKGLSDKQTDGFNTKRKEFIGLSLQNQIEKKLGYNTKTIVPMNSLQTGPPIETDKQIGIKVGEMGIKLVSKDKIGQAVVIECKKNKFVTNHIDLNNFFDKPKKMDASYFDKRLMWPSKKYMKYISKILNSKDFNNKKYQKLQMKILGK